MDSVIGFDKKLSNNIELLHVFLWKNYFTSVIDSNF